MGRDAAKATSTIQLKLTEQARAESSPDVLASERAANALLTAEVEGLKRERDAAMTALESINTIRNSIVSLQTLNWSEHVYPLVAALDRKSTRLNSSHQIISYAVFCLKKKKGKALTADHWPTGS